MILIIIFLAFDSQHCKKKCNNIFSDSPKKLESCLETCKHDLISKDKIQHSQQIMKKEVVNCISKCNENINSSTNFIIWSKCRKKCLIQENSNELHYFDDSQCISQCDRYWKGTVHWKPCTSQCEGFKKSKEKYQKGSNQPPSGIFNVW